MKIRLSKRNWISFKICRKSLNILLQEWGNRGLHYWEVDETNVDLVQGQSDYDFFRASSDGSSATTAPTNNLYGLSDILEAQLRNNRGQTTQSDSPMTKVDRSTYEVFQINYLKEHLINIG